MVVRIRSLHVLQMLLVRRGAAVPIRGSSRYANTDYIIIRPITSHDVRSMANLGSCGTAHGRIRVPYGLRGSDFSAFATALDLTIRTSYGARKGRMEYSVQCIRRGVCIEQAACAQHHYHLAIQANP